MSQECLHRHHSQSESRRPSLPQVRQCGIHPRPVCNVHVARDVNQFPFPWMPALLAVNSKAHSRDIHAELLQLRPGVHSIFLKIQVYILEIFLGKTGALLSQVENCSSAAKALSAIRCSLVRGLTQQDRWGRSWICSCPTPAAHLPALQQWTCTQWSPIPTSHYQLSLL